MFNKAFFTWENILIIGIIAVVFEWAIHSMEHANKTAKKSGQYAG